MSSITLTFLKYSANIFTLQMFCLKQFPIKLYIFAKHIHVIFKLSTFFGGFIFLSIDLFFLTHKNHKCFIHFK
jgi:hypothetical protein